MEGVRYLGKVGIAAARVCDWLATSACTEASSCALNDLCTWQAMSLKPSIPKR